MWKCPKCGGIIAKAMCKVPEKVKKAVMYIPSGTNNAPAICSQKVSPQDLILFRRANIIKELGEFVMAIDDLLEKRGLTKYRLAVQTDTE